MLHTNYQGQYKSGNSHFLNNSESYSLLGAAKRQRRTRTPTRTPTPTPTRTWHLVSFHVSTQTSLPQPTADLTEAAMFLGLPVHRGIRDGEHDDGTQNQPQDGTNNTRYINSVHIGAGVRLSGDGNRHC